ncbi:prepilin peptidase [bacterium]|nr:prepilin peptidase [bacterium]
MEIYNTLIVIYIVILGLIIGSFLNVVIFRIKNGENFVKGRSHCMHCKKTLSVLDLIPVISFLLLRGKCRYCKKKMSIQYPLVELATSFLFLYLYFNLDLLKFNLYAFSNVNNVFLYLLFMFFIMILLVIFVYDLKYYIIPDEVVVTGFLVAVFAIFYSYFFVANFSLLDNALGMILFSGFFAIQYFVSKGNWVGGGDIKLGLFLGVILGLKLTVVSLMLAYISGAAISLILIGLKMKTRKDIIPFGPFLILASFVSFFYGNAIISWYLGFTLR